MALTQGDLNLLSELNKYEENYNDGYYHLGKDMELYPDAWLYVIWSRRGPGKTYSALLKALKEEIKIAYMKRTNKDVETILVNSEGVNLSPYAPIDRDHGTCIRGASIKDGIGAFYQADQEGLPAGEPVSYVLSLNAVKTIKGMDLSSVKWMVLDEFIPLPGEKRDFSEGEKLLSIYMTANRDREKRGQPMLKLILFANAENCSTPITNELGITDEIVDLAASGKTHYYNEDRGILLHHITEEEVPIKEEEMGGIYKAFKGTVWFEKNYGGNFASNDFSNVQKISLKNYSCIIKIHHKEDTFYIYQNYTTGCYYCCYSPSNRYLAEYDLRKENDQKRFWQEYGIDLRQACIEDKMKFKKYSMYDLIINYKNFFKNL